MSLLSLRRRAVARLTYLQRACALGGVALSLLTPPAAQAQAARPGGNPSGRADGPAARRLDAARRGGRLSAPVQRIDAGAPATAAAGDASRVTPAFAATPTPTGLTDVGSRSAPSVADLDSDGNLDVLAGTYDGTFVYFRNTARPGATPAFDAGVTNPFGLTDIGNGSAPSVADLDGDGDLDVLSGEVLGDFSYFENTAGPGRPPAFATAVVNPFGLSNVGGDVIGVYGAPSVEDLDGDGDMDVLAGTGYGTVAYFENTAGPGQTPAFTRAETPAGLADLGYRPAPSVADLDDDGDMDVLWGEYEGTFRYFENTAGPNATPAFAAGVPNPFGLADPGAGSTPSLGDLDGDGDLDVLSGLEDGTFIYFENTTPPVVTGPTFAAPVTPAGLGGIGFNSTPSVGDLDGDGDLDVLAGEYYGGFYYFQNTAGPNATPTFAQALGNPFGLIDVGYGGTPSVGDLDGDGDLDVLAGERYGGFVYFENTAGPNATPIYAAVQINPFGLTDIGTRSAPNVVDLNGDGDMDVLAGEDQGRFVYFENTAGPGQTPVFATLQVDPFGLADIGSQSVPSLGDLDGDGDLDVVAGNFNGRFFYFENTAGPGQTPAFAALQTNPFGLTPFGFNSTPSFGDLDGDGDLDVLTGTDNGGFVYFENTQAAGGTRTARLTGTDGYRMLAAPSATTTIRGLLGTAIYTQGFPGATAPTGGSNVYRYDETAPGVSNNGYVAPGSATEAVGLGRGLYVEVFADEDPRPSAPGQQGGFPKTLTATGRPDLIDFDWGGATPNAPLSYTDTPAAAGEDGWNLLGNPFGTAFDWDGTTLVNVNAPVYVYDSAIASYRTHSRGIPNAGSLPGGVVAPFQGFWAQASAPNPSIRARAVTTNGGEVYREAEASAQTVVGLRLRPAAGSPVPTGVEAEAFLALGVEGAASGVDALDAFALAPPAQSFVWLATLADGTVPPVSLAIDARPAAAGPVTVDLEVAAFAAGAAVGTDLVLDWPGLALPTGWQAELRDTETGARIDLSVATEYAFTLSGPAARTDAGDVLARLAAPAALPEASRTAGRFVLVVTPAGATGTEEAARGLALSAARPNPTTGDAALTLDLPEATTARVAVYDALGRRVAVVQDGLLGAGSHVLRIDAGSLSAGTYVVRAETGGTVLTQRLTVMR